MRHRWSTRSRALLLTLCCVAWHSTAALGAGATVAVLPAVFLTANSLGIGDQPVVWTSAAQTVQLTNTGSVTLIIYSITIGGDLLQTNTCPTAAGLRTGTLTIADNTAEGSHQILLGGFGTTTAPTFTLAATANGAGVVAIAPAGTPFGPGSSTYAPGTLVTLRALAQSGNRFVGWTINGVAAGWANPLVITMKYHLAVVAGFAAATPIAELAARNTVRGYGDGRHGPDDVTLRAQVAALLARSMGREAEEHGGPLPRPWAGGRRPLAQRQHRRLLPGRPRLPRRHLPPPRPADPGPGDRPDRAGDGGARGLAAAGGRSGPLPERPGRVGPPGGSRHQRPLRRGLPRCRAILGLVELAGVAELLGEGQLAVG